MQKICDDKIRKIIKLSKTGKYSRPEIARMVGVSKTTCWKYEKLADKF